MIEGVAECVVRRPPGPIIDFVTDLERYKLADRKIGRVLETRREGDRILMRHGGRLRGIPGPPVSLEVTIDGLSVAYRSIPTFPSRWVLTFDGGFELTETPAGTRVVHTERFHFFAPWRFVAEPYLRAWLAADIAEEMVRLQQLLEADSSAQ
jgi:polyketide cyclase/dehydrase/lipid transport protein